MQETLYQVINHPKEIAKKWGLKEDFQNSNLSCPVIYSLKQGYLIKGVAYGQNQNCYCRYW